MKPLIVLLINFIVATALLKIFGGYWNWQSAGNISMFVMLCFTAMGHFKFTRGMEMMIPAFVPFKQFFVYLTGITEFVLGLSLLFPEYRHFAAVALIIFFLVILVANINATVNEVNYEKADRSGPGLAYLWFRIPLQAFFIGWVWFFNIR